MSLLTRKIIEKSINLDNFYSFGTRAKNGVTPNFELCLFHFISEVEHFFWHPCETMKSKF